MNNLDFVNFLDKYGVNKNQAMHIFNIKRSTIYQMTSLKNNRGNKNINPIIARMCNCIDYMGVTKGRKYLREVLVTHPIESQRKLKNIKS